MTVFIRKLLLCLVLIAPWNPSFAAEPAWTDRFDNFTDWAIYRGDKKANH